MTASELIKALQAIVDAEGDLPIWSTSPYTAGIMPWRGDPSVDTVAILKRGNPRWADSVHFMTNAAVTEEIKAVRL